MKPSCFTGTSDRESWKNKTNPIGVAAYQLQSTLPANLKGKLPTAKQLAQLVRLEMEGGR